MAMGLSEEEVITRRKKFGENNFFANKKIDVLGIFLEQFQIQMIILLFVGIAFAIAHLVTSIIILIFVISMAVVETIRELTVLRSVSAGREYFIPTTVVIRNGKKQEVSITELVPGDIVSLKKGMMVPADGTVISSKNCRVDEEMFGGKVSDKNPEKKVATTFERKRLEEYLVLAGTFVVSGECTVRIDATGAKTRYSRIIKQRYSFTKIKIVEKVVNSTDSLRPVIIGISIMIFLILLLSKVSFFPALAIAAAVAVAGVPNTLAHITEELFGTTLNRISKLIAIRRDGMLDDLKDVTMIIAERMKTLTMNRPTVRLLWIDKKTTRVTGSGWKTTGIFKGIKKYGTLDLLTTVAMATTTAELEYEEKDNKEVKHMEGDPIEGAHVILGMKNRLPIHSIRDEYYCTSRQVDEDTGVITAACNAPKNSRYFTIMGPAQHVLKKCKSLYVGGNFNKIKDKDREEIEYKITDMTAAGYTVWAVGYTEKRKRSKVETYTLIGLTGIYDPPKPGVKEQIQKAMKRGIKFAIVSEEGHGNVVQFARQMGILTDKSKAIVCDQLTYLRFKERRERILETSVFSESNSEYEKLIIKELKASGETVLFAESLGTETKALKEADVSLTLESSPDILKLNSDGILVGDRLDHITEAIKEARSLTEHVERAFYSLFTSDMAIVLAVLLSSILIAGKTMNVQQILLVNIIADSMIGIGLAFDRTYVNELNTRVRRKFPSTTNNAFALLVAVYIAVIAVLVQISVGAAAGVTALFATIVLSIITATFSFVSMEDSIFSTIRKTSSRIALGTIISIIVLLAVIYIGPLRDTFEMRELSPINWIYVIAAAMGLVIIVEIKKGITKLLIKQKPKNNQKKN